MAETAENQHFSSTLHETRVFPPPAEFAAKAHVSGMAAYEELYRRSIDEPDAFWAEVAGELDWFTPWTKVLDWQAPHAQWFVGGKLNLCHNCVDRHALGNARGEDRHPVGGRAGRGAQAHLPRAARRSAALRECAEGARREEGRSRRHLHGHDAGAGHRAAGMRAHRRGALGHLRRLCGERAGRSHQRRAVCRGGHAGRVIPAWRRGKAEEGGRRGARAMPQREEGRRLPADAAAKWR